MSEPISPEPERGARNGALPAYVSNGLVGLRLREVPLQGGYAVVNGAVGEDPARRIEALAQVPFPLGADVAVDNVWLSEQPWTVDDIEQSYDFASGELTSGFTWTAGARRIEVTNLIFASRTNPSLVVQELCVRADAPCALRLRAEIATGGVPGLVTERWTGDSETMTSGCDGCLEWTPEGRLSRCGLAYVTELDQEAEREFLRALDPRGSLITEYRLKDPADGCVRLRQITSLIPSILHHRPCQESVRRVLEGKWLGFDTLRERNRCEWDEIWSSRIVVDGASAHHQSLIDAALFYLNSSVHKASPAATSIFGLASWPNYNYYYGHVMWDIEAFCVPPLVLIQPDTCEALLHFRTRGRQAARSKARLLGRIGLQFPWEAAPLSGEEATPPGGNAAAHEDHVSLDVARAFALQADVTGDPLFLRQQAWPILSGVADWILDRVTWTDRGAEICATVGPAEIPDPPDNNAYTLMAAHYVLDRAIRAARRVGLEPREEWGEVMRHLYLPRRSGGVIASYDGYTKNKPKAATPSPLAGLFPWHYPASDREREATLRFYLDQWKDYVGAPMLPPLYPVWATMAGDRALALRLFDEGYAAYDSPRFHQCLELRRDFDPSTPAAGPFFANLGGMLMGLLYGFTGLEVDDGDPQEWARRPIVLPQGWSSIEVQRLWIRGKPARLTARHGAEKAEIRFDS